MHWIENEGTSLLDALATISLVSRSRMDYIIESDKKFHDMITKKIYKCGDENFDKR